MEWSGRSESLQSLMNLRTTSQRVNKERGLDQRQDQAPSMQAKAKEL